MRRSTIFRMLAPIGSLVAQQLSHPSGWLGRKIMLRVLDRGNRQLISETLQRLELSSSTRLLDVGFGGGLSLRLARRLGVTHLVGVELSKAAIESLEATAFRWTKGATLELRQGRIEALPLEDTSVDAIISTNTLYFWPDLGRAFQELWRVLSPGGHVALGFSSNEKLRSFSTVTQHGFLFHDEQEILRHAQHAGFDVARFEALEDGDTAGDRVLTLKKSPPAP